MLICNDIDAYREGSDLESVGLSTPREKLRSCAGQNELAVDQALANFVVNEPLRFRVKKAFEFCPGRGQGAKMDSTDMAALIAQNSTKL